MRRLRRALSPKSPSVRQTLSTIGPSVGWIRRGGTRWGGAIQLCGTGGANAPVSGRARLFACAGTGALSEPRRVASSASRDGGAAVREFAGPHHAVSEHECEPGGLRPRVDADARFDHVAFAGMVLADEARLRVRAQQAHDVRAHAGHAGFACLSPFAHHVGVRESEGFLVLGQHEHPALSVQVPDLGALGAGRRCRSVAPPPRRCPRPGVRTTRVRGRVTASLARTAQCSGLRSTRRCVVPGR